MAQAELQVVPLVARGRAHEGPVLVEQPAWPGHVDDTDEADVAGRRTDADDELAGLDHAMEISSREAGQLDRQLEHHID
jgi:hypothetical protein